MTAKSLPVSRCSAASTSLSGFILFFVNVPIVKLDSAQFIVGSGQPVTANVGEDAVLPCHLSPPMSAEDMEVRWFRSEFSSPVHLYRYGQDQFDQQMPEYRGRTEFLKDKIREGRVALRIRNIRIADEGQYRCFFHSSSSYGDAPLELRVTALGSAPLIAVEGYQDGGIRVVCRSSGWYPEPQVFWRDLTRRQVTLQSESTSRREQGLFETEASIFVTKMANLSCSVRDPLLQQEKESRIYIAEPFFPKSNPGIPILVVILVIVIILVCVSVYYFTTKERKAVAYRWQDCLRNAVKVTLNPDTANPYLVISPDGKCVRMESKNQDLSHSPEKFNYSPCVLGCEGFTSGKHYWGVEVGSVGGWAVGVARESVTRQGGAVSLNPEDGVWAVEHQWWGQFWALTRPMQRLPLSKKPKKIRVALDYEAGLVQFFDADDAIPLYTFPAASFGGEKIFPFFRVGGAGAQLRLRP
ncbi:butyrophilin subfamily 1 member A1-like isoform X2 [Carettochelys insculpta]|uniref:butyrophilin subfamily 1 member A1-like isoform X2 n=1 Tax=Carettochelys insculpta TaxID=44489 RepID=UPI003EBA8518